MRPIKKSRRKRQDEIRELFDPKAERKWERDWQNELIDLEEQATKDYEYADEIFEFQDEKTKAVIENMMETMAHMAGPPQFRFRGKTIFTDEDRLLKIQQQRFLFWAVRLLVSLAEWEIQIANFKLPAGKCARCGTRTKGK